jgi:thiol-disulfide isomerase/thioredoxin
MGPRLTRKAARSIKKKVVHVDSESKIRDLESMLGNGNITFVLIFAEWCGACHKFMKNVWGPMCKKGAIHNRAAVRDDMVSKTSLANTNFKYLPSVIIVNEKGEKEVFNGPDGPTNAMPTPQNETEMLRIVNVPVTAASVNTNTNVLKTALVSAAKNNTQVDPDDLLNLVNNSRFVNKNGRVSKNSSVNGNVPVNGNTRMNNTTQLSTEKLSVPNNQATTNTIPSGITYIPTPQAAPPGVKARRGGGLLFSKLRSLFRRTQRRKN